MLRSYCGLQPQVAGDVAGDRGALELCALLFLAADQLKDEILLAYHLPVYVASRIPLLLFPTQQMAMTQLL